MPAKLVDGWRGRGSTPKRSPPSPRNDGPDDRRRRGNFPAPPNRPVRTAPGSPGYTSASWIGLGYGTSLTWPGSGENRPAGGRAGRPGPRTSGPPRPQNRKPKD